MSGIMTSFMALPSRSEFGNAAVSMGNFEEVSSPPSHPKVLPLALGNVSPEMASRLIDELMRVIEEQAEVKLTSMENSVETQREPNDASSVYSQRSYYEVNEESRNNAPPAVVYYSAPKSLLHNSMQLRNGSTQSISVGPAPLKFSRNRESIAPTDIKPSSNRRGSKFILVDQTPARSLQPIGFRQSNMYETNGIVPQEFPTRMDSIYQGEQRPVPPSVALRRHSTDVSYMSLSDTASVHESSQNSILNYKKWIGASKTGYRVTSQKLTGPVVVEEKKAAKEKAPTISKSKSFFSHFNGYVAPQKKKPTTPSSHNKGSQRFSMDGSSSNAASIRRIESSTKSITMSTNSKENKQTLPVEDVSNWPPAPPSRTPPAPRASELEAKQPIGLISQLPWNHNRVPVNNKDFQNVEGWLSDTHPETSSPADPLSPVFSENNFASTAPTSPDGSNRLSVVLEGRRSMIAKDKENKMQSRIISWVDLEGCTPEFVQSLQVLGIIQGIEPMLTPIGGEDDGSIVPTPSSKYMDNVFVDLLKSNPEATPVSKSLPESYTTNQSQNYAIQPLMKTTTLGSRSASQSSPKYKPSVPPLIIPATTYSIFPTPAKTLSTLPESTYSDTITCTAVTHTPKTNFDEGDSPTLPVSMALPPRSAKRSKRSVGSPPTPSHLLQRQSMTNDSVIEEEDVPPPIPIRLRPITPPKVITSSIFLAPPTGLVLNLVRQYVSSTKSEWIITSPPTTTALLICHSFPLLHKLEFMHPQSQDLLFTFSHQRSGACSWVAESAKGELLFSIMESVFGRWNVVINEGGKSKKWDVNIDDLDEGREMDIFCESEEGRKEVGRIVARGRNTYGVIVKPVCDFAILACLTTVFDEWRVDEGFF